MSRRGDAFAQARRLRDRLVRIGATCDATVAKARSTFQLDVRQALEGQPPAVVKLVRHVLQEDAGQLALTQALSGIVEAENDPHERATDSPTLPPTQPPPASHMDGADENPDWGISPERYRLPFVDSRDPTPAIPAKNFAPGAVPLPSRVLPGALDVPGEALASDDLGDDPAASPGAGGDGLPPGLRYPEPGEPARQLADGTVVFDETAGAA